MLDFAALEGFDWDGNARKSVDKHGVTQLEIKVAANKRDVPYQSLIKMWLAEKVEKA